MCFLESLSIYMYKKGFVSGWPPASDHKSGGVMALAAAASQGGARAPPDENSEAGRAPESYSGSISPEPPNSFGKSLNFGRPSRTDMTFSP